MMFSRVAQSDFAGNNEGGYEKTYKNPSSGNNKDFFHFPIWESVKGQTEIMKVVAILIVFIHI